MKFYFQNFIFFICMLIGTGTYVQAQDQSPQQQATPGQAGLSSPQQVNSRIKLTQEEAEWLKAHPEVSVAVKHGYSPIEFIFELLEFRGISVDYLKKLEGVIGIKFNKRMADPNLAANDADMISSLTNVKSLEGTRFVALDIPFLVSPIGIFNKKMQPNLTVSKTWTVKKSRSLKPALLQSAWLKSVRRLTFTWLISPKRLWMPSQPERSMLM